MKHIINKIAEAVALNLTVDKLIPRFMLCRFDYWGGR